MRRLKRIISWTIWILVTLYVLTLVLVHLPFVQQFMGERVAAALSGKLGTEVSVGRVNVGFLNRLTLDNVVVYDLQQEELLRANRLSVKISLLPLLSGEVRISSAQFFGAQIALYREQDDSMPNWQFVVDAFSSNDSTKTPSSPDIAINSLIIRRSSVSYDQRDIPSPASGQFSKHHIKLSDISAHIILKQFTTDSLHVNVKRLAFTEQSGLQVPRFSAKFEAGNHTALLSGFHLQLPASQLEADTVMATYEKDRINETFLLEGRISNSFLTPRDFAWIVPQLKSFNEPLDFNAVFEGSPQEITCQALSLASRDNNLIFNVSGSYYNDGWQGEISSLMVRSHLLAQLQEVLPQLPKPLTRLSKIEMTGTANRLSNGELTADSYLSTSAGNLSAHVFMPDADVFRADVSTDSLDLQQLLDNDRLGVMAAHISLTGEDRRLNAEGIVNQIVYKGYTYHDISLNSIVSDSTVAGNISINDTNITTELEGKVSRLAHGASLRLIGSVANMSPARLNLTDRWGHARFSAVFDADITASSLNDAQGTIDIDDFVMTPSDSTTTTYHMDNLHLRSGYDDGIHFVRINGDMGTAELKGQFDWDTVPLSILGHVASRLPTIPGLPTDTKPTTNNFELELRLHDTRWLSRIFSVPLTLNAPLMLNASVNDEAHDMNIAASISSFTYGGTSYKGGRLTMTTEGDTTTTCFASLNRLTYSTPEERQKGKNDREMLLQLSAHAGENQLTTTFHFDNHDLTGNRMSDMHGDINTITQLYTNNQGKPEAQIRVLPSQLLIQGAEWQLEPCNMLYTKQRIAIDQFTVQHADQHLIVDGIISPLAADTLTVDLQDVDVAYLLDAINFRSIRFGGNATGKTVLTGLFGNLTMNSQLQVDRFTFMDGRMGQLYADVEWNADAHQLELTALTTDGPESVTHIDGYIAPSPRKEIDLHIRAEDSHIGFIHAFTKSFLSDIDGKAWGELRVHGPLGQMDLTGTMVVNGKARIPALGTAYSMRNDTLHFTPGGEIRFDGFRLYDKQDHVVTLGGGVHHQHLKNFTFDFTADATGALLYENQGFLSDTQAGNGDMAGMVFADGHADIRGRQGETVVNCNITPLQGSVFAYNTASPDAINNQQFITWTHTKKDVAENNAETIGKSKHVPSTNTSGDLRINFLINATPDISLRLLMDQHTGDYITLEGNGTLTASYYNKGPFQMFGTYTVTTGTYGITIQNILKKNFTFQDGGTVVFGGNPFDANLNLRASHTVNGVSLSDLNIGNSFTNNTVRVNCLMNIQGQAGAPTVEFDMELPNVNNEEQQMIRSVITSEQEMNQQVLYLLGIGRFYTQGANNASSQQYDQTQLAMQSLLSGTVSSQINEVLAQVIKSSDWNFGANISTGNEGWHNAEYEGLISGKLFNNRLLINGQFGYRDNATQATSSFIGDFDVRYLLLPNGNMALKVYNQTNDRYFTRSSLNTQGVGLILKRDFNGLGDLFHHRRRK